MERTLNCKPRSVKGKNEMNRLRMAGLIPGNLISQGQSVPVSFGAAEFSRILQTGLRQSSFFNANVEGGKSEQVHVKEIQRHPVTGQVLHVDFYRVTPGRRIKLNVAVEPRGLSRGVKGGGAMEHFIRSLRVVANPETVKEVIEVDITEMDVGSSVHLKDLDIPGDWDVRMTGNPIVIKVAAARTARAGEPGAEGQAPAK